MTENRVVAAVLAILVVYALLLSPSFDGVESHAHKTVAKVGHKHVEE